MSCGVPRVRVTGRGIRRSDLCRRGAQIRTMRCHYCDKEASFDVEKDGIRVWLCDEHLRERFEEMTEELPGNLDNIVP